MASSKVVTTNPDLPRQSSICSLSTLLADHNDNDPSKSIAMDDLLKSIYSSASSDPTHSDAAPSFSKTVDEVWKDIVAGTDSHATHAPGDPSHEMTLEDYLTKAGAVPDDHVRGVPTLLAGPPSFRVDAAAAINGGAQFPMPPRPMEGSSVEAFGNGIEGAVVGVAAATPATGGGGGRGKRRVVEEPVDKATLQKQRRMIKNRESAARSRERKQAYTVELESLVTHLEEENARLLKEEADQNKQRFKQLMECLIPVVEQRKPRRMLRRVNSVQW